MRQTGGTGQQMGGGQPMGGGQQMGGQQMGGQQTGGGTNMALQDVETPQQRQAIESITRAMQVCGWCAEQCIQKADPMMIGCIRSCEDVIELGETALALTPRQSQFAPSTLQTFAQAAEACAQECGQHRDAHCRECAQVLPQAAQAARQLSGEIGQQSQQMQQQQMQ
jgi:hypothetical protein